MPLVILPAGSLVAHNGVLRGYDLPSAMRAAILSIGDELTLGQNIDTNSAWIAAQLAERSILAVEHRTVADDRVAIALAVKELASRAELLVISGGLGPTEDDLTREALIDTVTPGQEPVMDRAMMAQIEARFARGGRPMPAMNRKQAMRPASMRCLPNANGTAPGLIGQITSPAKCTIVALPGPPRELQPMFLEQVLPSLETPKNEVIVSGTVHQIGMGESDAAQRLGELMDRSRNPLVGITVSDAIVSARVRCTGSHESATAALEETRRQIETAWQPYAFGRDDCTLAKSIGDLLRSSGRTLATAESCTGGWLGKMIVDRPGSSDYYRGGWITYTNQLKHEQLHVPLATIDKHGAVSQEVAQAMAEGALRISGADESLAITGIAGPVRDDAPSEKPVGTVFIALARKHSNRIKAITRRFQFPGDRTIVRDRSAKIALQMLRLALLDQPTDLPLLWEQVSPTVLPAMKSGQPVKS